MKKIFAAVLSLTMVMSFAACGKKKAQSGSAVSGTTAAAAGSSGKAAATRKPNPADKYVKHKIEKLTIPGFADEDGEIIENEEIEFHMPEIQIKSSYTESINKEVVTSLNDCRAEIVKEGTTDYGGSEYLAYLYKDEILSIVFIVLGPNDTDIFRVYNIDVKTGEKVDNARIAQIAGVSNIRQTAMDALQSYYNQSDNYKIENYKVVREGDDLTDEEVQEVEGSFGEKYLNDNMMIGLTDEGKIFFISEMATSAGSFFNMYDAKGNDLSGEDNPARYGYVYTDGDGDEGEDGGDE